MTQPVISQLETASSFDDRMVSTVRRYVGALGDELELTLVSKFGHRIGIAGASDPKGSATPVASASEAHAAAVHEFMRASEPASDDADANYARLLAARLNMMAAEIDAGAGRNDSKRSRTFVRRLRRSVERVADDTWIALMHVIDQIEATARAKGSDPESVSRALDAIAKKIRADFSKTYPTAAAKVDVQTIRTAIEAARAPRRGASKYRAFLPIARAIVGVEYEEELRKRLGRIRSRRRA